jgi:hypothetical protein
MAHFAKIDENNIVTQVIVVHNNELSVDDKRYASGVRESETKGIDFCESLYGHRNWVQTSYNNNIRYNYAAAGYVWDSENDAFYAPQPYPSWSLDENYIWQAPTPMPEDDNYYSWDEENQEWKIVELTV